MISKKRGNIHKSIDSYIITMIFKPELNFYELNQQKSVFETS